MINKNGKILPFSDQLWQPLGRLQGWAPRRVQDQRHQQRPDQDRQRGSQPGKVSRENHVGYRNDIDTERATMNDSW